MFYFLLAPMMTYNFILMAAAIIPAVFLMVKVYRLDRLDRESPALMWRLVKAGIFASLIALLSERVLSALLGFVVSGKSALYPIILYFGIVAFTEEGAKYALLKRSTWHSAEFNCQYDGVVYAVFVSLGFALWENVSYVMNYGFGVAIVRALTAIPGHTCFGVFMGVFYGLARKFDNRGVEKDASVARALAIVVPALLHGAYDYIASIQSGTWFFVGFIALLFLASYRLVVKMSLQDQRID